MGNLLSKPQNTSKQPFQKHMRSTTLVAYSPFSQPLLESPHRPPFTLRAYSCLQITDDLYRQFSQQSATNPSLEIVRKQHSIVCFAPLDGHQKQLTTRRYFQERAQRDVFLSNVLVTRDLPGVKLYSELNEGNQEDCLFVEAVLAYEGSHLDRTGMDMSAKLGVLSWICRLLAMVGGAFIDPEQIIAEQGEYTLTALQPVQNHHNNAVLEKHNFEIIAIWLFSCMKPSFSKLAEYDAQAVTTALMKELDVPAMVKDVLQKRINKDIDFKNLEMLVEGLRTKGPWMQYKMDSLHACLYHRLKDLKETNRQWILLKRLNKVYFYNLTDRHPHICSLVRKRRKIHLQNASIAFDQQQCELIIFQKQTKNTHHLAKANEFQLELHESISDITLHQKLPVNLEDSRLYIVGRKLYVMDKNLYALELTKPRVLKQLGRQLSKHLHLLVNSENGELYVMQNSRDIFRQGIRLWSKESEFVLYLAGNEQYLAQMAQLQVHLQQVYFCVQVFVNVYLLMASNNLFVLDLNFKCFFSYASLPQVLNYSENRQNSPCAYRYMFQILNQDFVVQFLPNQNSNNCAFRGGKLHVLGLRDQEVLALVYSFEPTIGALRLESSRSLAHSGGEEFQSGVKLGTQRTGESEHRFTVDGDEMFMYKYENWRYGAGTKGKFLEVKDFKITPSRSGHEFIIITEPVLCSLKDQLARLAEEGRSYSQKQTLLLAHRIVVLYAEVLNLQITHRNICTQSIYFTADKSLKLIAWAEPSRLQYASDYKDFMLLLFNVFTGNQLQKLSSHALQAQVAKYQNFEDLYKMTQKSIRMQVSQQRRDDIESNVAKIQQALEKELLKDVVSCGGAGHVFNFVYNTNKFIAVSIHDHRTLRGEASQEDQEFIFASEYQYLWNSQLSVLYILTDTKFFSMRLDDITSKVKNQLKSRVQDQEFLPKKVRGSTLCLLVEKNLIYSFGGVDISNSEKVVICNYVFVFDSLKLSWQDKGSLCYSLANSTAITSEDSKIIYLLGGVSADVNLFSSELKIFIYSVQTGVSTLQVDVNRVSPFQNCWTPPAVFLFRSDQPILVTYTNFDFTHKVVIMSLENSALEIVFTIDENQAEEREEMESWRPAPRMGSCYSSKDKSLYCLDADNRLMVVNFKNISQPFLEVIDTDDV